MIFLAIVVVIIYFLPWFEGAGSKTTESIFGTVTGKYMFSINGFGHGVFEQWVDSTYSSAIIDHNYGWLNIIGTIMLIIIIVLNIANYIYPLYKFAKYFPYLQIVLSMITFTFGLIFGIILITEIGEVRITYGTDVSTVTWKYFLHVCREYNIGYGLGIGFFVFLGLSLLLLILSLIQIKHTTS